MAFISLSRLSTSLSLFPLLLLLLSSIFAANGINAQTVPPTQCATGVHAILARGQGPGDDINVLSSISDLILKEIPGSTVIGLPYDHGDENKYEAVLNGSVLFQQYIAEYVGSCPDSKIFVLGYSMGAISMLDALCGTSSAVLPVVAPIDSKYAANVIVTIAYGDESYTPGQAWNKGTCTTGQGMLPRLNPKSCAPFAPGLQSYCDAGDEQCCGKFPWPDSPQHHQYFDRYNAAVIQFTKDRLAGKA